jgi:DNA polymerase III subunit gamma/tau
MSDLALYRKYRPQAFASVLGQEHVVSVLEKAVGLGNICHAYLFSGSRGTGKTSVARILAREIGTKPDDLYEIDAASNRGIDDIRALKESVNTLPFSSPYKVYIIDEVHMLTKEAFNALLKTLEEPPKHAVFILATTETEKLPETVVSRCQVFTFRKPSQKILREYVLETAKQEGFDMDTSSAELIALLGDGSFRDTLGILQKSLSSSANKTIEPEEVELVTGAPRGTVVNDFIAAIESGDLSAALTLVRNAAASGLDLGVFLRLVVHKLRTILLLRFAPDLTASIQGEFSESDFAYLKDAALRKRVTSATLKEFLAASEDARSSYVPELPLELALYRLLGQDGGGERGKA